jgi:hypothetical protein
MALDWSKILEVIMKRCLELKLMPEFNHIIAFFIRFCGRTPARVCLSDGVRSVLPRTT